MSTYPGPIRKDPVDAVAGVQYAGLLGCRLLVGTIAFRQHLDAALLLVVAEYLPGLLAFAA